MKTNLDDLQGITGSALISTMMQQGIIPRSFPVEIRPLLAHFNITFQEVTSSPMSVQELLDGGEEVEKLSQCVGGVSNTNDELQFIVSNYSAHTEAEKRMILAHLFGHVFQSDITTEYNYVETLETLDASTTNIDEQLANTFASAMLMPSSVVFDTVAQIQEKTPEISPTQLSHKLAAKFEVPLLDAATRLQKYRIITEAEFDAIDMNSVSKESFSAESLRKFVVGKDATEIRRHLFETQQVELNIAIDIEKVCKLLNVNVYHVARIPESATKFISAVDEKDSILSAQSLFIVDDNKEPCIFVTSLLSEAEKRYAIAHSLGHYVEHVLPKKTFDTAFLENYQTLSTARSYCIDTEFAANRFAENILAPAPLIRAIYDTKSRQQYTSQQKIDEIQDVFNLPEEVAQRRAKASGILRDDIKKTRTSR